MAFNVGERVRYAWNEPNADPSELVGEVREVVTQFRVLFDDGTEELCDEADLVYESGPDA